MGRRDTLPDPSARVRLRLTAARWTDGDYDQGGVYWGHTPNTFIYCGHNRAGVRIYARAKSPAEAATLILAECAPGSTCGGRVLVNGYAVDADIYKAQSQACADRMASLSR